MELPAGWKKRLADLRATDHGDGRPCITADEIAWAREYERRLLRSWARFPCDGEVYEATEAVRVAFVTHWRAAFTGGGEGTLPKGTRIRVQVCDAEPVGVYAKAENAGNLERLLVPDEDRGWPTYSGFSLAISTEDLNHHFRLVESAA
jgi:hypothetical protein